MFQPIGISFSVGEAITSKDTGNAGDEPANEVVTAKVPVDPKEEPKATRVEVQKETKQTQLVKSRPRHKQRELVLSETLCTANGHKIRSDLVGTIHLRSKSNEMDYVSSTGCGDSACSAFRSPPSSAQIFRPISFNFQEPLNDKSGGGDGDGGSDTNVLEGLPVCSSPPANNGKERSSPSFAQNNESTQREEDNQTGLIVNENIADGFEAPKPGERSSWLKDFNESLWSNYFVSSDQTSI